MSLELFFRYDLVLFGLGNAKRLTFYCVSHPEKETLNHVT